METSLCRWKAASYDAPNTYLWCGMIRLTPMFSRNFSLALSNRYDDPGLDHALYLNMDSLVE